MLIHWQNSYAPRGKQRTGRREAQSREPVNKVKKLSVETIHTCREICSEMNVEPSHRARLTSESQPISWVKE
jgi:hypothetical protein